MLVLLTGLLFGTHLHMNIKSPIYDYIDCLVTKGILLSYQNHTLPLKRKYISQMLIQLNNKRNKLSQIEQELLDEYLADYHYKLTDSK